MVASDQAHGKSGQTATGDALGHLDQVQARELFAAAPEANREGSVQTIHVARRHSCDVPVLIERGLEGTP
jgi:hypothetical protein